MIAHEPTISKSGRRNEVLFEIPDSELSYKSARSEQPARSGSWKRSRDVGYKKVGEGRYEVYRKTKDTNWFGILVGGFVVLMLLGQCM